MTPMVEFRSTLTPNSSEAVSFEGDVRVGFSEPEKNSGEESILTLVVPNSEVACELYRLRFELFLEYVTVAVYSDARGKVISTRTRKVLPDGFRTSEPISSLNQLNIRTPIMK